MRIITAGTAALALGVAAPAYATCGYDDGGGYVYVIASCVQDRVSSPANICQVEDGEDVSIVLFVSNIIHDAGRNDVYPESLFYDALQNRYDVTENGRASICYDSRREAVADRNADVARWRRENSTDIIVRRVHLPNG